ncbi:MAG: hypothetical protein ACM3PY_18025 [Omnitrophica WOR_2 bacterium]
MDMVDSEPLARPAVPNMDDSERSWLDRLLESWYAPKAFESTTLYERLGVLLVKRYAPTGGDFVNRRYGIRIANISSNLDTLRSYERFTRRLEAIHEIVFLGFAAWSVRRAATRKTTLIDLGFALVVYVALILSPAMLQRYNRLRVDAVIRRAEARERSSVM